MHTWDEIAMLMLDAGLARFYKQIPYTGDAFIFDNDRTGEPINGEEVEHIEEADFIVIEEDSEPNKWRDLCVMIMDAGRSQIPDGSKNNTLGYWV